jgi:CheY-like chemotaxis protein
LKFTPAGGGIFIELEKEDKNNWTIAVRDTGIGIPESDIPKLFKIDVKYSQNGLEGERGTGLGLSICHEIMQKHHGCISVESVQGKGTTFFLQLPKVSIEQGKSILIVDDAQGIKALHSKYIQRIMPDIKIVYASDGEEAFDMAQSLKPVLIITDHDMPRVNGYELVKKLKADTATQSIPIVCVTGHDSNAVHDELEALGVSLILIKPVSQEQFELVLKNNRICSNQINFTGYANN